MRLVAASDHYFVVLNDKPKQTKSLPIVQYHDIAESNECVWCEYAAVITLLIGMHLMQISIFIEKINQSINRSLHIYSGSSEYIARNDIAFVSRSY